MASSTPSGIASAPTVAEPRFARQIMKTLQDFKTSSDYFVGLDSDGCVFDSMEIKHKECFTPMS